MESNLFLAKHTHTPFAASDTLEAIMNRIVGGFTGTQTSGQHCEVLFQDPFTDEETKAEGPPLPLSFTIYKLSQLADRSHCVT